MKNTFKILFILILAFYSCKSNTNSCEPLIDVEGNIYKTVKIGERIWMAENLRVSTTPDKKKLKHVYAYDNNEKNVEIFGRLYNYNSAMAACPKGWHLPSKEEWIELFDLFGGYEIAGGKLKSLEYWNTPNTGATDEIGFSAIGGGFGFQDADSITFMDNRMHGDYWGVDSDNSWSVCFYNNYKEIKLMEGNDDEKLYFSVRYVKNK